MAHVHSSESLPALFNCREIKIIKTINESERGIQFDCQATPVTGYNKTLTAIVWFERVFFFKG